MAEKHHVVVDGSNLATEGRTSPSLQQLDEAVREYAAEDPDAEIVVVVDASFGHRIDPEDRPLLEQAELHGELVSPPAGAIGRGDAFVLRIAERTGAKVLSNDSFQEFHGEHPWLFDEGRLIGGKPVPGVGWIFTPRIPVRGPRSRQATGRARSDPARADLPAPVKAAELARAAKKVANRRPATHPDGSTPRIGDVWHPGAPDDDAGPAPEEAQAAGGAELVAGPGTGDGRQPPGRRRARRGGGDPQLLVAIDEATAEALSPPPAPAKAKRSGRSAAGSGTTAGAAKATKTAAKATTAAKPAKATTTTAAKAAKATKAAKAATTAAKATKAPAKAPAKAATAAKPAKATTTAAKATKAPAKAPAKAATAAKPAKATTTAANAAKAPAKAPAKAAPPPTPGAAGTDPGGRRRRTSSPPPAVNEPLAFINFVASYRMGSEVEGEVASFTSHGAMVEVDVPDGGSLHCYVPLSALGDPPPTKAREVLSRGERRSFVLVGLDPPRRVAELALPEIAPLVLASGASG